MRHLRPVDGRPGADEQGLVDEATPSDELVRAVAEATHVLVSPLRRAQQTGAGASVGGGPRRSPTSARRRSAAPPDGPGGSRGAPAGPSRAADVARLTVDADTLTARARDGDVVVVADGWANLELARTLRRRGWTGRRLPRRGRGEVTAHRLGDASGRAG